MQREKIEKQTDRIEIEEGNGTTDQSAKHSESQQLRMRERTFYANYLLCRTRPLFRQMDLMVTIRRRVAAENTATSPRSRKRILAKRLSLGRYSHTGKDVESVVSMVIPFRVTH